MAFKTSVNNFRRKMMRVLTGPIGGMETLVPQELRGKEMERILIIRPNGRLGNQLMITPIVQEISAAFPECRIDLFVKGGLSTVLFENYGNVDRIIRLPGKPFKELGKYMATWRTLRKYKYDLALNIEGSSSSGKLATKMAKAKVKMYSIEDPDIKQECEDYCHMAKMPVYNFRKFLLQNGYTIERHSIPVLDMKLSEEELSNGRKVLRELTGNDKPTIGIYTFATADKCYSKEWWAGIYGKMKERYGEQYNIVEVLPKENVSQIDFEAISWYSQDIREMAAVIADFAVFFTADCGVMHLATAVPTPVIGLFSITDINKYKPYNPGSVAVDTKTTNSPDELIAVIDSALSGS